MSVKVLGVTIDTGGADLKTDGNMFGMSRDKYGAAVVAGIFKALEILRPKGVKVFFRLQVQILVNSLWFQSENRFEI